MKRKVIKLGANSLLVSLPSSWVKKHGITKGKEVTVEEKEGELVLNSSVSRGKTTSIDLTNLDPIIKRALGALYKKGYDEFTITFSDQDELEQAYDVVREEFTGFEVVQHGKNKLTVREISQPHPDQFDTVLRRQFLVIKDFAAEVQTALQNKEHSWLKRLTLRDKDVNKLADFCRRLINKQNGNTGLYYIVEQLEKISDRYRDISAYAAKNNIAPSKSLMNAYREVASYLEEFYTCFYQFNLPAVRAFVARHDSLVSQLEKTQERANQKEQKILFWLEDITEKLHDMNGALMLTKL